jgi:biopolymer transport protein ExbD
MQSAPGSSEEDEEGSIFAEINITPLTDVFLVLLIIFMLVSSSMVELERQAAAAKNVVAERAMQVQTPQGSGETALVPKDIVVSILPDGTLFVEEQQLSMSELPAKLLALKGNNPATRVVIRGDQKAEYQLIMQVISTARSVGLTDVALASRSR